MDLKKHFGDRYKIKTDPSYGINRQTRSDKADLFIIPCQNGGKDAHLFSNGDLDSHLAIGFTGRKFGSGTFRKLLAITGITLISDCDDEYSVAFPLVLFDEVARIVKPRKKRKLTEENKRKLIEAGRQTRFSKKIANGVCQPVLIRKKHGVQNEPSPEDWPESA